jgi:hypothetical protein
MSTGQPINFREGIINRLRVKRPSSLVKSVFVTKIAMVVTGADDSISEENAFNTNYLNY